MNPKQATLFKLGLPLFSCPVSAGFPSPAEDFIEKHLSLDDYVIRNPSSSFYLRASGNSMEGAGIFNGDLLVVDRSLSIQNNAIVIACIDGEMLVKRLVINKVSKTVFLKSENVQYPNIRVSNAQDLVIWGIVIYVIHKL